MRYIEYNANPLGQKDAHDCVIRALSKGLNLSWQETAKRLYDLSVILATSQTSTKTFTAWLSIDHKIVPVFYENTLLGKRKRLTVADICRMEGTFIVSVARHLTVVVDGICYDTWDCTKKSAYKIWRIK